MIKQAISKTQCKAGGRQQDTTLTHSMTCTFRTEQTGLSNALHTRGSSPVSEHWGC